MHENPAVIALSRSWKASDAIWGGKAYQKTIAVTVGLETTLRDRINDLYGGSVAFLEGGYKTNFTLILKYFVKTCYNKEKSYRQKKVEMNKGIEKEL